MDYLGWDQVEAGAVLPSFDEVKGDIALLKQAERDYAPTNSYTASVADWRVFKPVFNRDLCIDCQNCWVFCPDTAIIAVDKKMVGIDYEHCKGCGVCVDVCPTNQKSLLMFDENEDNDRALQNWPEKIKKEK
ncbi:4Fe-4S dicluster domain-containing protein [Sulfurospirillum sp. 1612]|uniref:4Fe-4S dicluster domain-containing protein n=1 Tax=Sulfurospirillum sp. 1612 TaxID=3094835 RepID=UPI002F941547